jgi:hypothetical protein
VAPRAGAVGDRAAGAVVGTVQHPALTVQRHRLRPAHMPVVRDRRDIPRHAAAVPDIRVAGFPDPPSPFPCADADQSEHCAPSRAAGLDVLRGLLRIVRSNGVVVASVMSLLGTWRPSLPAVIALAETVGEDANDAVLRTGDLRTRLTSTSSGTREPQVGGCWTGERRGVPGARARQVE